jgi:hypothetical protein
MSGPSTLPDQRSTTSCFADHADENGFILSTDFLLPGVSATQILTKIERQNLLGDANVLLLGEETKRFFAAFTANTALFHSAERNAEIAH